jgi:hypothetical protein
MRANVQQADRMLKAAIGLELESSQTSGRNDAQEPTLRLRTFEFQCQR